MEPGNVIVPQQPPATPEHPTPDTSTPPTAAPAPAPQPPVQPTVPQQEPAAWQFRQEDAALPAYGDTPLPDSLNWTASEFIEHQKSPLWYLLLAILGVAAATILYLVVHDKISTGIILLAALFFGLYAARKPRTQTYTLSQEGIEIGQRVYSFADFKVFSIAEEGAIVSIILMPLKRFMPPLTVYVAPEMEDQVVDFLSQMLPFEQHKPDAVDSLLRRIRF